PGPDEFPGFLLGPDEIVPTGEELLASIVVLTETTVELEPGTPGDSGGPVDPDTGTESTGGSADGTGEDPLDTTSTGPGIDEPPPLPGGTAGTEETGAEPPAMDGAEAEGCGCHSGEGTGGAGWMAIALLGLLWRRRRPGRAGG
ncbi:MAG: MYXO-CTERM sorting domain-containing protein, partial [Nannocystaceae bacterium]